VLWHRGFALSDIMLGAHVLEAAKRSGVGTMLTLFDEPDEQARYPVRRRRSARRKRSRLSGSRSSRLIRPEEVT
jgi:hypothetical protein